MAHGDLEVTYVAGGRTQKLTIPAGTQVQALSNGQQGLVFVQDGSPVSGSTTLNRNSRIEAYPSGGKLGGSVA